MVTMALCEDAAKKHLYVADRYSGIIVLMSYDYLDLFHECMQLLLEQGCGAVESSASAKALKGRIHASRVCLRLRLATSTSRRCT